MESIINKTLGNIINANTYIIFNRSHIENTFVGNSAIGAGIEHLIMVLQSIGHIVGIQNGHFGCLLKTRATHHADIHPSNRQNTGAAKGCRRNLSTATVATLNFLG